MIEPAPAEQDQGNQARRGLRARGGVARGDVSVFRNGMDRILKRSFSGSPIHCFFLSLSTLKLFYSLMKTNFECSFKA